MKTFTPFKYILIIMIINSTIIGLAITIFKDYIGVYILLWGFNMLRYVLQYYRSYKIIFMDENLEVYRLFKNKMTINYSDMSSVSFQYELRSNFKNPQMHFPVLKIGFEESEISCYLVGFNQKKIFNKLFNICANYGIEIDVSKYQYKIL